MGPKEFIAWFRFHYNLPQLLRGDTLRMVAGTAMTTCHATQQCIEEEALLDPTGAHVARCHSAKLARSHTHTQLAAAVQAIAVEAGCSSQREPSTASLLGNEFSTEECRHLFPKKPTAAAQESARMAAELAKKISDITTPQNELHTLHTELAAELE